jgi:hypothetical protein
LMPKECWKVL